MLGISTYKPKFHTTAKSFKNEFDKTLSELIGKKIERFWLMWNVKDDEWLTDGPVILEIDGKRFEFSAYKLDEFSLTINSFKLTDKLDWYGLGNEMPLIWKENGKFDMTKNLNKAIVGINIITYDFTGEPVGSGQRHNAEDMLTGIEFVLEKESEFHNENFFSIFNGLDKNAMEKIEIHQGNRIKRIKIPGCNTIT